jgi:tRNA(Ile)-lysidine synthase
MRRQPAQPRRRRRPERADPAARLARPGFAELDPDALGEDRVADAALAALLRAVAGAAFAPPAGAVAALRRRGAGTLGGAWMLPGPHGWRLAREPAAVAPPVPAVAGAVWDGRFRLAGPGEAGCWIGALGAAAAARLRGLAPHLPAAILATLPAVRRDSLDYLAQDRRAGFDIAFAPVGDPVSVCNSAGSAMMKQLKLQLGHSRPGLASLSCGGWPPGIVPTAPWPSMGRGREQDMYR